MKPLTLLPLLFLASCATQAMKEVNKGEAPEELTLETAAEKKPSAAIIIPENVEIEAPKPKEEEITFVTPDTTKTLATEEDLRTVSPAQTKEIPKLERNAVTAAPPAPEKNENAPVGPPE